MKRIIYIIITMALISALSLPFSLGVLAHTEGDPFVTDLIAGGGNPTSGEDVGEVRV